MTSASALEYRSRYELVEEARALGVERPERMTMQELKDEILRLSLSEEEQVSARGLFGVARAMLASVVEAGLKMPDAAKVIRGDVTLDLPVRSRSPVATVTLAEIYAAQGHRARALAVLDEVLAIEPDHEEARRIQRELTSPEASAVDASAVRSAPAPVQPEESSALRRSAASTLEATAPAAAPVGGGTPSEFPSTEYVPVDVVETSGHEVALTPSPGPVSSPRPVDAPAAASAEASPAVPVEPPPAVPVEPPPAVPVEPPPAVPVEPPPAVDLWQPPPPPPLEAMPDVEAPPLAVDLSGEPPPPLEPTDLASPPTSPESPSAEPSSAESSSAESSSAESSSAESPSAESPPSEPSSAESPFEGALDAAGPGSTRIPSEPVLATEQRGSTLHLYWELPPEVVARSGLTESEGEPAIVVVAFTPAGPHPLREQRILPLDWRAPFAGSLVVPNLGPPAAVRAAVGWVVEGTFLPLAVGRTLERWTAEGSGVAARARAALDV